MSGSVFPFIVETADPIFSKFQVEVIIPELIQGIIFFENQSNVTVIF